MPLLVAAHPSDLLRLTVSDTALKDEHLRESIALALIGQHCRTSSSKNRGRSRPAFCRRR